ncbi:4Fe-4S dicluster domain-containing protein [Chloroflexota bacterium]
MTQILDKKELSAWLDRLLKEHLVVAPQSEGELTLFLPVHSTDDIVLDFENTSLSPKEWLFPKTETLFAAKREGGDYEISPSDIEQKTVIFGIRPCDAKAIAMLDFPFLAEPADSLWAQHREKTYLIGLSCNTACSQCFCTSMGTAPNDPSDVDILLTEVGDSYAVQTVTEKGKQLLEGIELKEQDLTLPPPPSPTSVPAEGISEAVRKAFDEPYWSRLADRCIHCNVCAYVCPTCYCFDIRDYPEGEKIERLRTWESCQSKGFTRIAGGHDPRADKGIRLRQRFAHKLLYFPQEFGPLACVGCGRCVTSCPVNIDIREIINDVQKLGAKVG